ncbi:MAG: tRNA epoxyqueuosine(34) reductase QueG [Candidatus Latescibacterota bacterium]|nr:tRNA epoxyqueuosine(34) reductase QueG [Candidatus Latescibacterota bacterium]
MRTRARELGFDLVGIAPADPLEGAEFYARWVALGFAGEMTYLQRNQDKRADPARLVPGARSVICVGMHYHQEALGDPSPLAGRMAQYALGDDYHDLLKDRLRQLWASVREEAGEDPAGRYFVDTAPVLERELANRAGLGWWGKNTCLINQWQGSYFLLGEIVTEVDLEWDHPAVDHCGTCTRCLDACPTDAFPEPYVLDARRCISYLTIELKGSIPEPLRPLMGNWIFGCDICQEVCPWNKKAPPVREPALETRSGLQHPPLTELLAMDRDAFNELFRRNPAKRPKRRGLQRNVAVALGNSGSEAAVPALTDALRHHDEPLVRAHAAWALGRLGGEAAATALEEARRVERDEQVVGEIAAAVEALDHSDREAAGGR